MIRKAELTDATQLVEIYNHYVLYTTPTLEEEVVSIADFQMRIEKIGSRFPFIVYEEEDTLLGYAYANTFRERVAYRHTVETSIYLRHDLSGKGIGSQLYTALIDQIKTQGFHRAIGVITLPNDLSVVFHEKFGFKKAGHFHEVGKKFGKWLDVGFWQLNLSESQDSDNL